MDVLIKDMLECCKTGNRGILIETENLKTENIMSFNVMVSNVLSWLSLGYKRELWKKEKNYIKQKPLDINLNYPWCQLLKNLVETDPRFQKHFFISDKYFDFRESVTEEERVNAMKLVYDKFPKKMIT